MQSGLLGGLLGVALAEGVEYRLMLVHDFLGATGFFPDHHPGHDRPVQDTAGLGLEHPVTGRACHQPVKLVIEHDRPHVVALILGLLDVGGQVAHLRQVGGRSPLGGQACAERLQRFADLEDVAQARHGEPGHGGATAGSPADQIVLLQLPEGFAYR